MTDRLRTMLHWAVIVLVAGILSGVSGALLTLVLETVQHVMIGYSSGSFGDAFSAAPRWRRVLAPALGSALAGLGWWWVRRARPVTRISAMHEESFDWLRALPVGFDALLQILIVGAGASIGREGAPRQVAAASTTLALRRRIADPARRAQLVAVAAGAGLAAVYTTPLAGAVYAAEVVQRRWSRRTLLLGVAVSLIATLAAWPVTRDAVTYTWPAEAQPTWWVVVALPLCSPLWSCVGGAFTWLLGRAREGKPSTSWPLVLELVCAGVVLGLVACLLPQVPGNGKALIQGVLPHGAPWEIALLLVLTKPVLTAFFIRARATGGLLTPALATGAAGGAALVSLLATAGVQLAAAPWVVVAAAGVLAVTQRAPWFAGIFVIELTHPPLVLVPSLLVTGWLAHTIAVRMASGPRTKSGDAAGTGNGTSAD